MHDLKFPRGDYEEFYLQGYNMAVFSKSAEVNLNLNIGFYKYVLIFKLH
jgi:hypothetical protein